METFSFISGNSLSTNFTQAGQPGSEQRQLAAVVHPVQEFGGFLHDRQVGGIAGVEDLVKAHGVEGRHGLAHGVLAVGQAEGIPHRYPDCRGDLGDHPGIGVTQGGIDTRPNGCGWSERLWGNTPGTGRS